MNIILYIAFTVITSTEAKPPYFTKDWAIDQPKQMWVMIDVIRVALGEPDGGLTKRGKIGTHIQIPYTLNFKGWKGRGLYGKVSPRRGTRYRRQES